MAPEPPIDIQPVDPKAVQARKPPPPEASSAIWTRSYVTLSYWLIVLLLGLPMWLWTTSIHRAQLPVQRMLEWADGKACKPSLGVHAVLDAPQMSASEAQQLVNDTAHHLSGWNELFNPMNLSMSLRDAIATGALDIDDLYVKLVPEPSRPGSIDHLSNVAVYETVYDPNRIDIDSQDLNSLASKVGGVVADIVYQEHQSLIHFLKNSQIWDGTLSSKFNPRRDDCARRASRAIKYSPTYHITISLFTPTSTPSSWDIEAALQEYMAPLLSFFSPISNFTIDTQVQTHAEFAKSMPRPEQDEATKSWILPSESLSSFINAAEWPLSPSIGDGPTINFLVYVPDPQNSPLVVNSNHSNSWLIPQKGGVHILNPTASSSSDRKTHLTADDIRPALHTFSRQLLELLDVPRNNGHEWEEEYEFNVVLQVSHLPIRIQSLKRLTALRLIHSASLTLGSLARLTTRQSQIPIPEHVATGVDTALSDLESACQLLRDGKFSAALRHAQAADREAETAFFEKTMVSQLYFPDEHAAAVYLPLLAPIAVPLITMGAKCVRQISGLMKKERAKST